MLYSDSWLFGLSKPKSSNSRWFLRNQPPLTNPLQDKPLQVWGLRPWLRGGWFRTRENLAFTLRLMACFADFILPTRGEIAGVAAPTGVRLKPQDGLRLKT